MISAEQREYETATKTMLSVVGFFAIVAALVLAAVIFGNDKLSVDPKQTVYINGGLYGNFRVVDGTPGYAEADLLPYDSLWGPMAKNTKVTIDGRVYGKCVGIGAQTINQYPTASSIYNHVRCIDLGAA